MMRWAVLALAGCNLMKMADDAPGDDGPPADAAAGVGEPAELAGITLAHNQVRVALGLSSLAWDASLAATAATYAAKCIDADADGLIDHNPGRSAGHPWYVGENIYGSTGKSTGQAAVDAWAGEVSHYHYASNTCDAGEQCGHYTQVVWRDTQKVGCALHDCAALKYRSTLVCDYGPGGNVNNQRPY